MVRSSLCTRNDVLAFIGNEPKFLGDFCIATYLVGRRKNDQAELRLGTTRQTLYIVVFLVGSRLSGT